MVASPGVLKEVFTKRLKHRVIKIQLIAETHRHEANVEDDMLVGTR